MKAPYILLIISSLLFTSCGGNNSDVTAIKDCAFYKNDKIMDNNLDIYFFKETKDIPCVDIAKSVTTLTKNYTYQLTEPTKGLITNSSTVEITIDFSTGDISYNDFDLLMYGWPIQSENDLFDYTVYSLFNKEKIQEESTLKRGTSYSVNIKEYGFDFTKYKEQYYLPIDLLSLICFEPCSYYYENHKIYCLPVYNEDLKKSISFNHNFTKKYYEHCFNIFMINQEIYSGLKGVTRKQLSDNKNHTFFENGVLATLLPYKDKIINSKTIEEFDKGMMEMMAKELNSGGHDNCNGLSFNDKQSIIYPSEYDVVDYTELDVRKARKNSADAADFDKPVFAYDADNDGKKDIGYVTFDHFSRDPYLDDEGRIMPGVFQLLTDDEGANTLFNRRLDSYDSKNYNIKDIVIDLSANEGGEISVEQTLISWICGGKCQIGFKCVNTGTYNCLSYKYDIYNDGEYDNKDYLPDDINIYILTSNGSYSSANLLPFDCHCYNENSNPKNKIKFIGQRPAGGCCGCTGPFYLATGFCFFQSQGVNLVNYKNVNTPAEIELPVDKGLELTLSQMVDRTGPNGINNLLVSLR